MNRRHRHDDDPYDARTMHRWTARHYILTAILVLVVMGLFVYSWS
jgi:heme/copper-type cytochrome/quinol oxidase subunit 2